MTDQRADAQTTYEHEIAELRQELATLRAEDEAKTLSHQQELESLRAEFAALRAAIISATQQPREADVITSSDVATGLNAPAAETGDDERAVASAATSRRTLLKLGGMGAAAALAAAGGSALTSQTAHAADGAGLVLGTKNYAEHVTYLQYDGIDSGVGVLQLNAGSTTNNTTLRIDSTDATPGNESFGIYCIGGRGITPMRCTDMLEPTLLESTDRPLALPPMGCGVWLLKDSPW